MQPRYTVLSRFTAKENKDRSAQSVQDEAYLSPAATRAGFSSAPRLQISIAYGIRSVILLVTTSVVSAAATIQPPEVRRTDITRERLCWNDHADKSEREGIFQRKYRMKRRTFKKLVALFRPALERDYCKNYVLAVS